MQVITAFRNLDSHGEFSAPRVIAEESAQIESRLERFNPDLVQLEITVTQTHGKKRFSASLRLDLPSGLIAAREEGFEVEPVLRKAFADLRKRLERHLSRLTREPLWKRPARRRRLGAPLPPVRDAAEAERRALYFDLIEEHLDTVYRTVRRELTYLESTGEVPEGLFTVRGLVDATILRGLDEFERRPPEFSVGDWLTRLAYETIEAETRAVRRAVPDGAASLEREPEKPAEDPTESDQEMFEFYQPDDLLVLEDLVIDETAEDAEEATDRQERALALHRALAQLPARWRRALVCLDVEEMEAERAAAVLGMTEDELAETAAMARAFLRAKLVEAGMLDEDAAADRAAPLPALGAEAIAPLPLPIKDREAIAAQLAPSQAHSAA